VHLGEDRESLTTSQGRPDHRGEDTEPDGGQGADLAPDLDQQVELDQGDADEEKEKDQQNGGLQDRGQALSTLQRSSWSLPAEMPPGAVHQVNRVRLFK